MTPNKTASTAPATGQGPTYAARRAPKSASVLGFVRKYIFPQPLRTGLTALVWLGFVPLYIQVIATYDLYAQARMMAVGLIMATAIAVHLWPTRTPGWRTLVWAAGVSAFAGANLLILGADRYALTGATAAGFVVAALRVNSNGRKAIYAVWTRWATR